MNQKCSLALIGVALFLLFSQPAFSADCSYFSASIKVGKPFTGVNSPVKAITFYWAGVNVTINGNGQLISKANSAINYYYDNKNKRYSSVNYRGQSVKLSYTNSPYNTNKGNIMSISRSPGNIIRFDYNNNNGYLSSISYQGNVMRFYYHSNGTLNYISQPVPVKCVYATYDHNL